MTRESNEHILIVNTNNQEKFSKDSWANAQNKISEKLKDIPVKKSVLNRNGKGCLILPDENSTAEAREILKDEYYVEKSTSKRSVLLPRLKIHGLDPSECGSKEQIYEAILTKNRRIKDYIDSEANKDCFSVCYLDKQKKFATLKVSPNVRKIIMKDPRIFIGLGSYRVTDYHHVTQCFQCQGFSHIHTSEHCPRKASSPICMYCSGEHKSSECRKKNTKQNFNCVNCAKSNNREIRQESRGHTANSGNCPMYKSEIDRLKSATCYEEKNYQKWVEETSE